MLRTKIPKAKSVGSRGKPRESGWIKPTCPAFRFIFIATLRLLIAVKLPYRISTLIYGFNDRDEVLLMQRAQEPNLGLWSPFGGKLKTDLGESPYACACRETFEEIGLKIGRSDLHLTGIISEHGYQGAAHWLMFLFEILPRLKTPPPPCNEGPFEFFTRDQLTDLPIPQSDREQIWPQFWKHRGGFFAAHCQCHAGDQNVWTLEASNALVTPA